MEKTINHFTVNDLFWINMKDHLINYSLGELPKSLHYTIVLENSPNVNLHITRNIDVLLPKQKPSLKIFIVDKKLFENALPHLALSFFKMLFQPFDLQALRKKHGRRLYFYPLDKHSSTEVRLQKKMIEVFTPIAKLTRGKTRLKLDGDIEDRLKKIVFSQEMRIAFRKNAVRLTGALQKRKKDGIIFSAEETYHVVNLGDKWYTMSQNLDPMLFLKNNLGYEKAIEISWKIRRAIVAVSNAKCRDEIAHLENPIEFDLFAKKKAD